MRIKDKIQLWSDNLKLLSGMDRLEYIIELGRKLLPLDDKLKIDSFKIHGCAATFGWCPDLKRTH